MVNNNEPIFQKILSSESKKICVIAGPGTGKTQRVIIPYVKKFYTQLGIKSESILIISFSRLSAQDVRKKISDLDSTLKASTLHSFCLSYLLFENNHDLRKRIKTIVLDNEKDILLSDLKQAFPSINKNNLKSMLKEFSAGWAIKAHDKVFEESDLQIAFKNTVKNWLDENEAVLMEEIVYNAVILSKRINSDFLNKIEYIFIDEYQDLNELEQEFIRILSANAKKLVIVGDPDQSIYSFKYAYPEGIIKLQSSSEFEQYCLEYTGRCGKKVIGEANKILCLINPTRSNQLKPLPGSIDDSFDIFQFPNQENEFQFVIDSINKIIDKGVSPEEIIVLTPRRQLGKDLVKFATEKTESILKYKFVSKDDYSETEKEKILLFGILANPDSVLHIRAYVSMYDNEHYSREFSRLKIKYGDLERVFKNAHPEDFQKKEKKIRKVCYKILEIKSFIEKHKVSNNILSTLDELFPDSIDELNDLKKKNLDLYEESDSLADIFRKFQDSSSNINTHPNTIKVMTIMASKGLEADHVFIIGCNNGNIPGKNSSTFLSDYEHKQEQKRLLYVGITRARKSVIITWSRNISYRQSQKQKTESIVTRKIKGIPYSCVGICEFLV